MSTQYRLVVWAWRPYSPVSSSFPKCLDCEHRGGNSVHDYKRIPNSSYHESVQVGLARLHYHATRNARVFVLPAVRPNPLIAVTKRHIYILGQRYVNKTHTWCVIMAHCVKVCRMIDIYLHLSMCMLNACINKLCMVSESNFITRLISSKKIGRCHFFYRRSALQLLALPRFLFRLIISLAESLLLGLPTLTSVVVMLIVMVFSAKTDMMFEVVIHQSRLIIVTASQSRVNVRSDTAVFVTSIRVEERVHVQ